MSADSPDSLPTVLVPGLNCSARLYAEQIPALWRFGPVMVADHTRDAAIAAIARRILVAQFDDPLRRLAHDLEGDVTAHREAGERKKGRRRRAGKARWRWRAPAN